MFDEILNLLHTLRLKISAIRAILQANKMLGEIAFNNARIQGSEDTVKLTEIISKIPEKNEWQSYEHCAAVTRLYAVYENFVEDLISQWLRSLPQLVPSYSDLDERIKKTHREGVGRLLLDLKKKNRYKNLSENDVIEGLFYGVTGNNKYDLIPDAFLWHEQNLRKDILNNLLENAGIADAWNWVSKHRSVKKFVEEPLGSQSLAATRLDDLIIYRNEAAHRVVINELLGVDELLEFCDFIESLCQALVELVTYRIILQQGSTGQVREIGQVTRWFEQPKAARAKVRDITLSVGQRIFLASETKAYCQLAIIESIQIDDVSQDTVEIITETEVGLKFNTDARKGLSLYVEVDKSSEQ